ncbi:MAG: LuxR C-terminal-related transcriptional regulator [Vicinamibacterales bacterium]
MSDPRLTRPLTPRQRDVLALLAAGHNNSEIGVLLRIGAPCVKSQIVEIDNRIHWPGETFPTLRARAVAYALRICPAGLEDVRTGPRHAVTSDGSGT